MREATIAPARYLSGGKQEENMNVPEIIKIFARIPLTLVMERKRATSPFFSLIL